MKSIFTRLGLAFCLALFLVQASAQFYFQPANRNHCSSNGGNVEFSAAYFINDTDFIADEFSVSIFSVSSGSIIVPAPEEDDFESETATIGGVGYTFTVSRDAGFPFFYTFTLEISGPIPPSLDGTMIQFVSEFPAPMPPTMTNVATLFVKAPLTIDIVSPDTTILAQCEGTAFTIDGMPSRTPTRYEWLYNNTTIVKSGLGFSDFTIPALTPANQGNYRVKLIDAACPTVTSEVINLAVNRTATIIPTDLAPKELLAGQTTTFTATATRVDFGSTYTWNVDGVDYEAGDVPATFSIGSNTFEINSITNIPAAPDTMRSTISITNTSAPDAPYYTAPVSLTVTNNAQCVASVPTVMSGTTSIFPVTWAAFTAQRMSDKEVRLEWETSSESNNDKFWVERSVNGRTFQAIGALAGAGNSQSTQTYRWIDGQLPTGATTLYYRIQQVDFDGQFSYSDVRTVSQNGGDNEGKLSPVTIVGHEASALLTGFDTSTPATYRVFDARGVLVRSGSVTLLSKSERLVFPAPDATGVYVLQILADGEQWSRSFAR